MCRLGSMIQVFKSDKLLSCGPHTMRLTSIWRATYFIFKNRNFSFMLEHYEKEEREKKE